MLCSMQRSAVYVHKHLHALVRLTNRFVLCEAESRRDDAGMCVVQGKWLDPSLADGFMDASPCAQGHVGLKPKRGAALLFFDQLPDGTADTAATHTACPVIRGTKWSAPVWIHPEPWRRTPFSLFAAIVAGDTLMFCTGSPPVTHRCNASFIIFRGVIQATSPRHVV